MITFLGSNYFNSIYTKLRNMFEHGDMFLSRMIKMIFTIW